MCVDSGAITSRRTSSRPKGQDSFIFTTRRQLVSGTHASEKVTCTYAIIVIYAVGHARAKVGDIQGSGLGRYIKQYADLHAFLPRFELLVL